MKTGDKVWIVKQAKFHKQLFDNMVAVSVIGSDNSIDLIMVKPEQIFAAKPETNEVLAKRIAELERELVKANNKLGCIKQAWNKAMLSDASVSIINLREAIEGN